MHLFLSNKYLFNIQWCIFFISLLLFLVSIFLFATYNPIAFGFQYLITLNYFSYYVYIGIDGISISFIFLTTFFIPLCLLYIWNLNLKYKTEYFFCFLIMEFLLVLVFIILDLVFFYIFFESVLIPFYFLILWNGSRVRKIHAAYLLFFYTICSSICMLVSILYISICVGTTNLLLLWNINFVYIGESLIWFSFVFSFSVKIPIFPFHIWLPEAHVESPTEVSVILAAVLLKIGGFAFIKILIPIFPETTYYYSFFFILWNSISYVYTSFVALRQIDIKRIIAYSSIGHMNICMIGLMTFDTSAIISSLLLMIGHGFISGGLFFMVGIFYDRFKTKNYTYYSGIVHSMPIATFFFFFFMISNISFPFTSNFIGELFIISKVIAEFNIYLCVTVFITVFISTAYSIWLINRIFYGFSKFGYVYDLTWLEFCILLPIVFFILVIGIYPDLFINLWDINIHYYYLFKR